MHLYFDFDGTLADTGPALVEAVRLSFMARDLPPPKVSEVMPLMGFPLLQILGILLDHPSDSQEILVFRNLVEEYYAEMVVDEICLFPGMRELVEEFSQKAQRLAILTNKPTKCVLNETQALKIQPFFKAILGADLAGASKPERDILDMAHIMMALTDAEIEHSLQKSVMVGDSTPDIGLAKQAGMISIGVTWGAQDAVTLKREGADYIAETVKELREILLHLL
ncbi:HAD family hydrolase [Acetobacteraceae bacterium]|nr:HAD family hydrolase [Acetobacteraceae bacterium]